jgi:hypothetical protein
MEQGDEFPNPRTSKSNNYTEACFQRCIPYAYCIMQIQQFVEVKEHNDMYSCGFNIVIAEPFT